VFFSLRLCTWLCRSVIIKLNFPLVVLAGLCNQKKIKSVEESGEERDIDILRKQAKCLGNVCYLCSKVAFITSPREGNS
jgi:hypothetical protein